MKIQIYNSLGRQLQDFTPIDPNNIKFYHCGPTVYWIQHIGNMRAMLMADIIRRTFMFNNYNVQLVRNYTDFGHLTSDSDFGEDRMEKGAKREGLSPKAIADKYIELFEHDSDQLNILRPTVEARATNYLSEMIKMVQELLDKNIAYSTAKGIYFDISKFSDYTKLSGQKIEFNQTSAGHGTEIDEEKRSPQDFAIWFYRLGVHANALQFWNHRFENIEQPTLEGFPGWHIECSAMVRSVLGKHIDIHMGGVEHIPVHHTNEIAQSECANDSKYVNYWVHNEHITIDGKKLSKSDGNIVALSDVIQRGYSASTLRYFFLQAHYRSKQNFTWESLESADTGLKNLKEKVSQLNPVESGVDADNGYISKFNTAINTDFNIPKSLAVCWEMLKDSNLPASTKYATITKMDTVLGLKLLESETKPKKELEYSTEIQALIDQRVLARASKDYAMADKIRDELQNKYGVNVIDNK